MTGATAAPFAEKWPPLQVSEWRDTYQTLHRWMQIVGKTRLALAPMQNHWWQVALYLTARGLTTSAIPYKGKSFDVEFDFIDHALVARTSDGDTRTIALEPMSVARFFGEYEEMLRSLGIEASISPIPSEMSDVMPFDGDETHAAYEADTAQRCWRILSQTDRVLKEFRGRFLGKSSPSHVWWGGFDISCTRFSGRPAPPHPGGIPNLPDWITREAYSHECISAGWWPGFVDGPVTEPAFYAYAYPEPPGCPEAQIGPAIAAYNTTMREWILPYEAVRNSANPDATLLEFLESTYGAAADLGAWDRSALERAAG